MIDILHVMDSAFEGEINFQKLKKKFKDRHGTRTLSI